MALSTVKSTLVGSLAGSAAAYLYTSQYYDPETKYIWFGAGIFYGGMLGNVANILKNSAGFAAHISRAAYVCLCDTSLLCCSIKIVMPLCENYFNKEEYNGKNVLPNIFLGLVTVVPPVINMALSRMQVSWGATMAGSFLAASAFSNLSLADGVSEIIACGVVANLIYNISLSCCSKKQGEPHQKQA